MRTFGARVLVAVAVVALLAPASASAQKGPIKIGMIVPQSGPLGFDDDGNPIMNIYVRKVERANGRLQNTVIHTVPAVSQFWTYRPEELLKQPVDDRNTPPCKHCP